jgi:hypothetical protein
MITQTQAVSLLKLLKDTNIFKRIDYHLGGAFGITALSLYTLPYSKYDTLRSLTTDETILIDATNPTVVVGAY